MPLCIEGDSRIDTYPRQSFMLFQSTSSTGADAEMADLVPANFSGYAAQSASVSVGRDTDDYLIQVYSTVTFAHNGGATANTIQGWAMYQSGAIHYIELFDSPIEMATAADVIAIDVSCKFGEA